MIPPGYLQLGFCFKTLHIKMCFFIGFNSLVKQFLLTSGFAACGALIDPILRIYSTNLYKRIPSISDYNLRHYSTFSGIDGVFGFVQLRNL